MFSWSGFEECFANYASASKGGPRGRRPRLNHWPVRCIPSLDYSSRAVVVVVYLIFFVFVYVIVFSCICHDSRRELITTSSRQCEHCGGANHTPKCEPHRCIPECIKTHHTTEKVEFLQRALAICYTMRYKPKSPVLTVLILTSKIPLNLHQLCPTQPIGW